jgi:sn-1 stearoyl-lipid 9-desaturase
MYRPARHGLSPGQIDVGFLYIFFLERLGLAWDIQAPEKADGLTGQQTIA